MKKFGRRLALTAAACAAVGLGGCLGEDTKEAAKKAGEQAAEAVEKAAKDAAEATKKAAEATKEAAGKAAEAVKETTKAAAEKASEAAAVATEKAREATAAAKEKANEVVAAAKQDAEPAPAAKPASKEPPAWARGAQMNPDYTPAPKVTKSAEPAAAPAAVETASTEPKAEEPKPEPTPEAAPAPAAEETVVAEAETPAEAEAKKEAAAKSAVENHDKDVKWEDGRYRLEDGTPTYKVTDGVVDWASWEGFRRYHDACHVCHGPNALGGSFAPSLADSLKTMSYDDFVAVVAGGRVADRGGTQYVMPALGGNPDVMCYLDDIYTYIKGRSAYLETSDAKTTIPPGRPIGREDISDEARQQKKECLPE